MAHNRARPVVLFDLTLVTIQSITVQHLKLPTHTIRLPLANVNSSHKGYRTGLSLTALPISVVTTFMGRNRMVIIIILTIHLVSKDC